MPFPATLNGPKILAGFATSALLGLPDTCSIERNTTVSDGMGGQTDSWATIASNVACRVNVLSGSQVLRAGAEMNVASKLTSISPREVVLPVGQDIAVNDRLVYGSQTIDIKALLTPSSFELYVRVLGDLVQ